MRGCVAFLLMYFRNVRERAGESESKMGDVHQTKILDVHILTKTPDMVVGHICLISDHKRSHATPNINSSTISAAPVFQGIRTTRTAFSRPTTPCSMTHSTSFSLEPAKTSITATAAPSSCDKFHTRTRRWHAEGEAASTHLVRLVEWSGCISGFLSSQH